MSLLGYIGPRERTPAQQIIHENIVNSLPPFYISGNKLTAKKVFLFAVWNDPLVVSSFGRSFTFFHQLTGSCVGVSSGNVLFTLLAVQIILKQTAEKIVIPFWPYSYGIGRMLGGMNGQGEGSFNAVQAKAVTNYGNIDASTSGLPTYTVTDGILYTSNIEYKWSDGRSIENKWTELAKQHQLKTAATLNGVEQVKDALSNGYPVHISSSQYIGKGYVKGSKEPCVMGTWDGSGGHATSILGFYEHPEHGPIYWYQNTWGESVYPKDPLGGPTGGCWMTEKDLARIWALDGECFAYSNFNGFPAPTPPGPLDWWI